LVSYIGIFSQNETCNTPQENDLLELNTISISKCSTSEKTIRKINNNSTKNRNVRYVRKITKPNNGAKNTLKTKTILFSVVDEIPLFPKCYSNKDKICFKNSIQKHFYNNFHPEKVSDDGINGRVFIQFIINTNGTLSNINVKGPINAYGLTKEVTRVLHKLPIFKTGKHQGIPVPVKYSLPLNFHYE